MKRILSLVLAFFIIISVFSLVSCDKETGLIFELNEDEQSYTLVSGLSCTDKHIIIPEAYEGLPVTSIGDKAFMASEAMESISIPSSVTSIDMEAFYSCTSLKEIAIPDSVTQIGKLAFVNCDSLASVTIPASVEIMGYCVFKHVSEVSTVIYCEAESQPSTWDEMWNPSEFEVKWGY